MLVLSYFGSDEYEWTIVESARTVVEAAGGSVVSFVGAALSDPHPEHRGRAFLLDLIDASNADAVLCVSSVVGQYVGSQAMGAWLRQKGLPSYSIGVAEGVPSVGIDDADGVTQLMRHLIEHHRLRRIAFIRGTESNSEAQARHRAYEAALEEHDIAYDPRLVLPGEFTRESGTRAISELFDTRQVPVEAVHAIVAANDYTAFGVIDELSRRRIAVPEQVAVVGFDDVPLAALHAPALSTVRQPLERLGAHAARVLLDLLAGGKAAVSAELGTELVLRRSCGCVPTDLPPPLEPDDDEATAVAESPHDDMHAVSARELEQNRLVADELASRLRLAREDLTSDLTHRLARALEARMFGPQALLSTALAEHLPKLGIDACVVSELAVPGAFDELKLAFGFDSLNLQPQVTRYPAKALVPPAFAHLAKRSVVALPLSYGEQPLGLAVLPASDRDGAFYDVLAEVFGVVLKALEVRRRADSR